MRSPNNLSMSALGIGEDGRRAGTEEEEFERRRGAAEEVADGLAEADLVFDDDVFFNAFGFCTALFAMFQHEGGVL